MPKPVTRAPQLFTADEFFAEDNGLPEKMELWDGIIGPYEDAGLQTLLANWGAYRVLAVTGPDIWREALAAYDAVHVPKPPATS
jgi:hypothetical protein